MKENSTFNEKQLSKENLHLYNQNLIFEKPHKRNSHVKKKSLFFQNEFHFIRNQSLLTKKKNSFFF